MYVNLGKINSAKLNNLVGHYPKVKIFGISEVRVNKGYIDSGKLIPPGYIAYYAPYDKTDKIYSMIMVAREYLENITQIESLGSFCSVKIDNGKNQLSFRVYIDIKKVVVYISRDTVVSHHKIKKLIF